MSKQRLLMMIGAVISWRLMLFVIGGVIAPYLAYEPSFPYAQSLLPTYGLPQWIYSWANFDGVHYLTIAEKGYIGTGLIQAFFPGYPLSMMALNWVVSNSLISGLIIANVSLVLTVYLWFLLMKKDYGWEQAKLSGIAFLLFPTAFFLGAVYGESLFIGLVLASFLAARHQRWAWVGLFAGLASATRVVGVLLIPALVCELMLQVYEQQKGAVSWQKVKTTISTTFRHRLKDVLLISLGLTGLVAYMHFLWGEFHDPLYFVHVQSEFGGGRQETLVTYPQVVWRYLKILMTYRPFDWKYYALVQEAVVGGLGLIALLWSVRSIRLSYVLFALGAFLVPTMTGTFSSLPRYILVCFPLFILLARAFQSRRWLMWFYLLVSTLLLILNTVLFIQGYWVA
jgi:hypothetical protein